jgi:hypothetical protein
MINKTCITDLVAIDSEKLYLHMQALLIWLVPAMCLLKSMI